jgi:aminoglycoside phosphotransferase (APT) family kinase protein
MAYRLSEPSFLDAEEYMPFDRQALARYLATQNFAYDPDRPVRQFAGGLANRTYLIELDGDPAVLRRPPAGELPRGAHDMGREHRVLAALSKVLPLVPAGLHYCPDPSVIGAPFQLIEYRAGGVIRDSAQAAALAERQCAELSEMLVRILASIHRIDPAQCGLDGLGRPEGFVQRTITGWARRGADVLDSAASVAHLNAVMRWLDAQPLAERTARLIHLDFKLDNLILDEATLEPRAIVDWDMGTRGDPLFDLATLLSYWAEPGDPPELQGGVAMPTAQPGFWTRRQVATAYAEATGESVDDLLTLYVLALMRLGVVYFQLHRQWLNGAVKSTRYAEFDRIGAAVLEHAAEIAAGRRAGR